MPSLKMTSLFDTITKNIFFATIALLPIFFVPLSTISIHTAKGLLIPIGILSACSCWLIARMYDRTILLPHNRLFTIFGFIVLISIISGLSSPVVWNSFFGTHFSLYTTSGTLLLIAISCLGLMIKPSVKEITQLYFVWLGEAILIGIFQIILLSVGGLSSVAQFISPIDTTLGSMSDMAIFYGAVVMVLLLVIELVPLSKMKRNMLGIPMILAFFFLLLSNVLTVWILLGVFSFGLFIFCMTIDRTKWGLAEKQSTFPFASFAVILITLFCVIGNSSVGPLLSNAFGIMSSDIRPSFTATLDVTMPSLEGNPVFGSGPNRFVQLWTLYRPTTIIESVFSDIPFTTGFSYMMTLVSTTGIFGFVSVGIFFIYFLYLGVKRMLDLPLDYVSRFIFVSTFSLAIYFWVLLWLYTPSVTHIAMAFIFSGLHLGFQWNQAWISTKTTKYLSDSWRSVVSMCLIGIVLCSCVIGIYVYVQKGIASGMLTKAIATEHVRSAPDIETMLVRVANLEKTDLHYRSLAHYYIEQLSKIPNTGDAKAVQSLFQSHFSNAEMSAEKAIALDSTNYLNWTSLALVYQQIVPLNIDGAYKKSFQMYQEAVSRNPHSRELSVLIAKLEFAEGNIDEAKVLIQDILLATPNNMEALLLLSQIEMAQGSMDEAIEIAKRALLLQPNYSPMQFHLGFMYFSDKQYNLAKTIFQQILEVAPYNVDAKYLLARSVAQLGDKVSAQRMLEELLIVLPNNEEIISTLMQLTSVGVVGDNALNSEQ